MNKVGVQREFPDFPWVTCTGLWAGSHPSYHHHTPNKVFWSSGGSGGTSERAKVVLTAGNSQPEESSATFESFLPLSSADRSEGAEAPKLHKLNTLKMTPYNWAELSGRLSSVCCRTAPGTGSETMQPMFFSKPTSFPLINALLSVMRFYSDFF